jgi:steroid delta-isomerase-like uncharacterized protein
MEDPMTMTTTITTTATKATTTADQKKAKVRRVYDELWNQRRLDVAGDLFTDDYENHDPATPGKTIKGRDAFRALIGSYTEAFPDLRFDVVEQHCDGDTVVSRWFAQGTHQGALMGIPATGRRGAPVEGITISRFAGDRIACDRIVWDLHGLLRDLGAAR